MTVKKILTALLLSSSLQAVSPEVEAHIRRELKKNHHQALGSYLHKELAQSHISLTDIQAIAQKRGSQSLSRAVDATKRFQTLHPNLGMSLGSFLQTAIFIEADIKKYTSRGKKYLSRKKTKLPRTLEHDKETHTTFIVLDGVKEAFLGQGAKKTAYKSIDYNHRKPRIVARAEQIGGMAKELRISKLLRGSRGIYSSLGSGEHKAHGKRYTTIYSDLYNSGDLRAALEKKMAFSLYEKASIALNILYGLEALHKHGIAHRDLGSKNMFLNIEGVAPRRTIDAVIADFGWSNFVKEIPHRKAQANYKNTAPEGIDFKKLKGSQYFGTDVFATGMVLYHLVTGEKVAWSNGFKDKSPKVRKEKLIRKINATTRERRLFLENLYKMGHITVEEELEYHILRMLNPNAKERPAAGVLREAVERVFQRLQVT